METKKTLYKDKSGINRRNKKEYDLNLKDLAELVKNAEKNSDGKPLLQEKLLNNAERNKKAHPVHEQCDFPKESYKPDYIDEKRICRCMKYYGQDKKLCDKCELKQKWNNVGKFKITDYEVPMEYVISNVGGIDLLIDNQYAVEIKPEGSQETLVRMFAEILTYTIDSSYQPTICFFKHSKQMQDFERYRAENNESLKLLMEYVSVFYISYKQSQTRNDTFDYEIIQIEE